MPLSVSSLNNLIRTQFLATDMDPFIRMTVKPPDRGVREVLERMRNSPMAISALKFIGLAVGAVALGVISASLTFEQMGFGAGEFAGYGLKTSLVPNDNGLMTKDEMPGGILHIMRRH